MITVAIVLVLLQLPCSTCCDQVVTWQSVNIRIVTTEFMVYPHGYKVVSDYKSVHLVVILIKQDQMRQ